MSIPTPAQIGQNLKIILNVAKLQKQSTTGFDSSSFGLQQSFMLVPFLFPIFFFEIAKITWFMDDQVSSTSIFLRSLLVFSTIWTLFPVVLYSRGIRQHLHEFVVARNWLLFANFLVALIASFGGPFALIGLAAGIYFHVMNWFVIRDALRISNGKTTLFFIIEFILNNSIMMWYFFSVGIDFEKFAETLQKSVGG